jgi:hypothetical protein
MLNEQPLPSVPRVRWPSRWASSRGMQEHRARTVAWSLAPIALGHALYRRGGSHRSTGPGGAANAAHPGRRRRALVALGV